MIKVEFIGFDTARAKLQSIPPNVRKSLLNYMYRVVESLRGYIITGKLSGQVLNHRTGKLWRAIHTRVDNSANSITGRVFATSDCKYAAIHEFGGTTKPHIIEARNKKALAFMMQGKKVIVKRVEHPGSKMPERSYLRSALKDKRASIEDGLKQAVADGLK